MMPELSKRQLQKLRQLAASLLISAMRGKVASRKAQQVLRIKLHEDSILQLSHILHCLINGQFFHSTDVQVILQEQDKYIAVKAMQLNQTTTTFLQTAGAFPSKDGEIAYHLMKSVLVSLGENQQNIHSQSEFDFKCLYRLDRERHNLEISLWGEFTSPGSQDSCPSQKAFNLMIEQYISYMGQWIQKADFLLYIQLHVSKQQEPLKKVSLCFVCQESFNILRHRDRCSICKQVTCKKCLVRSQFPIVEANGKCSFQMFEQKACNLCAVRGCGIQRSMQIRRSNSIHRTSNSSTVSETAPIVSAMKSSEDRDRESEDIERPTFRKTSFPGYRSGDLSLSLIESLAEQKRLLNVIQKGIDSIGTSPSSTYIEVDKESVIDKHDRFEYIS